MSESQRFLLDVAAIVLLIWLGASLGFTFNNLWKDGKGKREQQQFPDDEGEHATNQADRTIENGADVGQQSNDHEDNTEQHRLPRRQLNVAIGLNMITLLAAVAGLFALYFLYGTLVTTRTQAETAQQEFELSERPWVYTKQISPDDGLSYDNRGARFSIRFSLSNIGHSPAAATWIYLKPYDYVIVGLPLSVYHS